VPEFLDHVTETAQTAFEEQDESHDPPIYYNVGNVLVFAGERSFSVQVVDAKKYLTVGRFQVTIKSI